MPKAKGMPVRTIGRCVYGPDHAPPLTEEHILAANLGGEITLLNACCRDCQKIINEQVERPCQQEMFREIRYRRGIGSRRVGKRPKELRVLRPTGGDEKPPSFPDRKSVV